MEYHSKVSPKASTTLIPKSRSSSSSELLPQIDDLGELKLTLYYFLAARANGRRLSLSAPGRDFLQDSPLYGRPGKRPGPGAQAIWRMP